LSNKRKKNHITSEPRYPIVIYPVEEGGYVAEIPALKGCLAQGETPDECLKELTKVQALWLESARRNNENLPSAEEVIAKLRKMVA
jgi:predicted RNase H-like HicB family nuclease